MEIAGATLLSDGFYPADANRGDHNFPALASVKSKRSGSCLEVRSLVESKNVGRNQRLIYVRGVSSIGFKEDRVVNATHLEIAHTVKRVSTLIVFIDEDTD